MKYRLQRYEEHPTADPEKTRVFVSVKVIDDAGDSINSIVKEVWLAPDEVAAVTADHAALEPIVLRLAALGEIELERKAATKPPPPLVLVDDELREQFPITFEQHKIGEHKAAIVEDANRKEAEEAERVRAANEKRLREIEEEKAAIEQRLTHQKAMIEAELAALKKEGL